MIGFIKSISDTLMGRTYTHSTLTKASKEFAVDHVTVEHIEGKAYVTYDHYRICEFCYSTKHLKDSLEEARDMVAEDYYQKHEQLLKHNGYEE